ncbi:LacI transcriptional regulator, partial [Pseudomonas syringae pv. pisi str. 1704B]
IELGEIESVLASQAEVQDAVVLVRGERLLAWFTENAPVEPEALREALRARLPAHMVPRLTSIRTPREEVGQRAAQVLLGLLDGVIQHPQVDLGFELVVRESS